MVLEDRGNGYRLLLETGANVYVEKVNSDIVSYSSVILSKDIREKLNILAKHLESYAEDNYLESLGLVVNIVKSLRHIVVLNVKDSHLNIEKLSIGSLKGSYQDYSLIIGKGAFRRCTRLRAVDLSGCNNLVSIDESAFEGVKSLEVILLSNSLRSIKARAFKDTNLIGVNLADCVSLKEIDKLAFDYAPLQKKLELPANIEYIGECAFQNQKISNIEEIDFSRCCNLKVIKYGAFYNGAKLKKKVVLPSSLEVLEEQSFGTCGLENGIDISKCNKLKIEGDMLSFMTPLDMVYMTEVQRDKFYKAYKEYEYKSTKKIYRKDIDWDNLDMKFYDEVISIV